MATQYIANHPIKDMCLEAERNLGLRLSMICWDYPALVILGIRVGQAAEEEGGDTDTEESDGEGE